VVSACQLAGCSRTAFYRAPAIPVEHDAPIIDAVTTLVAEEPRWGFWTCVDRLRALGHGWNHML
jgi:putative transposase